MAGIQIMEFLGSGDGWGLVGHAGQIFIKSDGGGVGSVAMSKSLS